MSNHNYTQYSNNKNKKPDQRVVDHVDKPSYAETPHMPEPVQVVEETVATAILPKTVKGVVANCAKLNVRAEPSVDADVLCVLNVNSEVEIDVAKSSDKWLYVCTITGIEGYCMKQYIDAQL